MNEQKDIHQSDPHKLRVILKGAIVPVVTAVIVGVGVYMWQQSTMRKLKGEMSRSQHMLEEEINELRTESEPLHHAPHDTRERQEGYLFRVYGPDREYTLKNGEVNFYVAVPETLSLLEKVELLASDLSRFRFGFLPIEVARLEDRDGKTIAIINLRETEQNQKAYAEWDRAWKEGKGARDLKIYGRTWRSGYFQGSTGGYYTKLTLTKTFLQEEYEGEWMDGVEFRYEGRSAFYGHCYLEGTMCRKKDRNN